MSGSLSVPKFPLGQVVATPGALQALAACGCQPGTFLARHVCGDWGTLDAHDAAENELALTARLRLLSVYPLDATTKLWIITEADRSVTTLLLPSEY